MTTDEWNPKGTAHRRYPECETNPAGWDKLRAQVEALDEAELELLGLRRIEPAQCEDWLTRGTRTLWLAAEEELEAASKAAEEEEGP